MTSLTLRRSSILAGLATVGLLGCGEGLTTAPDLQQVPGDVGALGAPPDAASTIAFETFSDDAGARASTRTRTLIRSASAYASFFGHAPPAGVDFSTEWVMFYAAGSQPSDGYQASFVTLLRAGASLFAVTQLSSPAGSCKVNSATPTAPYALIKFPAQPGSSAQFFKNDVTHDCTCGPVCLILCENGNVLDANGCPTCACNPPPADPCATVDCSGGTHCDSGKCIPDGVACGGFAGTPCPGSGQCADDPYDSCDPKSGGADCPGICQCVQTVACKSGDVFNSSPSVCACQPAPPDPCATVKCAAGTHCDSGKCAPDGVSCGGIAGTACPGFGKCTDDPYDSCDPNAGGADCAGVCTCIQTVACTTTTVFDSSPSVCACVAPNPNPCPPEKCPTPGPKVATIMCGDGTTAGPVCVLTNGTCAWAITSCTGS